MPKSLSAEFFKVLINDIEYTLDNGIFYVSCTETFKDVFIMVQERWIQILGEDMVMDISKTQDGSLCILNWVPSVDDFWVFGNHIYKDYYITHKPEEAVMSFTPTKSKKKEPLATGVQPERKLEKGYNWLVWLAKFLCSGAIGAAIWAMSEYLFVGQSWEGLTFLNAGSLEKEMAKKQIAKKIQAMDTNQVTALLNSIQ